MKTKSGDEITISRLHKAMLGIEKQLDKIKAVTDALEDGYFDIQLSQKNCEAIVNIFGPGEDSCDISIWGGMLFDKAVTDLINENERGIAKIWIANLRNNLLRLEALTQSAEEATP